MNWLDIVNKIIAFVSKRKEVVPFSAPKPVIVLPAFDGTQLSLIRKTTSQWSTMGELSINGVFECFTIELPKTHEHGANTCIVPGTYSMSLYQGSKHDFKVPLLNTDTIGRSFIEIHPSNFAIRPSDGRIFLEGCIAPGTSQGQDFVNSSKVAFDLIMSKIDWTKPVQIIISEQL